MTDYMREIIYLKKNKEDDGGSCGYVRLEKRRDRLNVCVMVKELYDNDIWPVYLVVEKKDGLSLWPIGDISEKNRAKDYELWQGPEQIRGVLIGTPEHYLAGTCRGAGLAISFEQINGNQEDERETEQANAEEPVAEVSKPTKNTEVAESTEIPPLPAQEPEKVRDPFLHGLSEMYPFEDDEMEWCLQMQPKDFTSFPMPFWHLANNSFLLHGFYNYRHLLYAHSKDKNYVGVPGQFHRREQYLAGRFGFTRFKATQKKAVTMGDFGYWMKQV